MQKLNPLQERALRIYATLEKARLTLGMEPKVWRDVLGMTEKEYLRDYIFTRCERLPISHVMNAAKYLNLAIESILIDQHKIDFRTLFEHFNGNTRYVPERYTVGAFSKRSTMQTILAFVDSRFGPLESFTMLRHLQVSPAAIAKTDEAINLNFASDLMERLSKRNVPKSFFWELGINSINKTAALPFAQELAKARTIRELYEQYLEDKVRHLEKNSIYRIVSAGDSHFIVEAIQNPEVVEALKNTHYGSSNVCAFKTGGLMRLPHYAGFESISATKIKCIHNGDPTCRWLVQFSLKDLKRPSFPRLEMVQ